MSYDNVLNFPNKMRDAIDDESWRVMQGEFYLDCFFSQHGHSAENPEILREWLQEAEIFAEIDNPFFRGWLVRRLQEQQD